MSDQYTPDLSNAQSYYASGRAQLRRQITGEQAIDVTEYSHEFNRWLAERDAEVAAKAWDLGYTQGFYDREKVSGDSRDASEGSTENPYWI